MTPEQLWEASLAAFPENQNEVYEAWCFGGDPDELLRLTLLGIKTATASAYPLYAYEHCPLPKAGELSILTDASGSAKCILRTTRVSVVPFLEVSAEHAWKEGEGDRSLEYWREVHRKFFTEELKAANMVFTEDMPVVCEEFTVLYRED